MSQYFVANVKMTFLHCGSCGVPFAMSNDFITAKKEDHETWYCPRGCPRYYPSDTEEEKLKRKLREKQERLNQEIRCCISAREEANHLARSRSALKGQITKLKKKIQK